MPTRLTKFTRRCHGWLLTIQSPSISHLALLRHLTRVVGIEQYCVFDVYVPANCTNFEGASRVALQCHLRCHFEDSTYKHTYLDRLFCTPYTKTNRHVSAYVHLKIPVSLEDVINDYFRIDSLDVSPYAQIPVAAFQTRFYLSSCCNGPMLTTYTPCKSVPRADLPSLPYHKCAADPTRSVYL